MTGAVSPDLFHAAESRDAKELEDCLEVIEANESDSEKNIALHHLLSVAKSRDVNKLQSCSQVIGVNESDFEKNTAMHHLLSVGCFCTNCVKNLKNCLEILFLNNADPNLMNTNGQAPLDVAIENVVPIELVKLLVDNGAKLVTETGISNRNLMRELIKHSPKTVYEMLDEGVRLNEPSIEKENTNCVELHWSHLIYNKENWVNTKHWRESAFLYDVFQKGTPQGKQLILTHPLVKAFLERKSPKYWLSFGGFYCTWITITFILYLTFIWTLYNDSCRYSRNETLTEDTILDYEEEQSRCTISVFETVLAYLILVLYLLGPVGLEMMEMWTMKPKVYFQQWTNYIFFPASALIMVTLYPALREKRSYHLTWQYPSAAV
ncbi:unnamed protein product [Allacma fusca]|uniref:Uncharacterized protein n=1 Tax=Allacma fusca TaxID=39272 RepID=A0A8J2K0G1_9HEXA|nr:unnamed protein product [Allacma fusca]